MAGTPDECLEKARVISRNGVDILLITAIGPIPGDITRRFGREVIARF